MCLSEGKWGWGGGHPCKQRDRDTEHTATYLLFSQMEMPFIVACSVAIQFCMRGTALPTLLGHITNTKGLCGRRAWHPSCGSDPEDEKTCGGRASKFGPRCERVCTHVLGSWGGAINGRRKQWGVSARNFFALIPIPHPYPHHTHPFFTLIQQSQSRYPPIFSSSSSLAHSKDSGMFHHELFSEWSTWEPSCRLRWVPRIICRYMNEHYNPLQK